MAAIRGLKVFFSDKQEKGHFSEETSQACALASTQVLTGPDVHFCAFLSLLQRCRSYRTVVALQEDPAHAQRYRIWLTKHQSSFCARLRRLLTDKAAPELQVLHLVTWL